MPTYNVTDPNTGRKIRLTGDSPPTEQELEQIFSSVGTGGGMSVADIPTGIAGVTEAKFSQAPAYQKPSLGQKLLGAGEAALSAVTGATTGALGYLGGAAKGIGQELIGGVTGQGPQPGSGYAEQQAMQGSQAFTYAPKTQAGKEDIRAIGETLSSIPAVIPMASEIQILSGPALRSLKRGTVLIDKMGEPTPALRKALDKAGLTFENLSPEAKSAIPSISDPKLLPSAKSAAQAATKGALVQQLKSGARDDALAGLRLIGNDVVADKVGVEAIRQGFEPGFVQAVKTATPATRAKMDEMLTMMERITKNRRLALDFRPSDIIGDTAMGRVNYIRNKANEARTQLNVIANDLKGVKIDSQPVVNQLMKSLDDLDISIEGTKNGVPVVNFKGSMISKDPTSQRMIRNLIDLMGEGGTPDALRFHKLKRQLDTMIDFQKKSAGGLTDAGKNVLKDIRSSLNQSLRQANPKYAEVNDTLHNSLTALDDFSRAVGPSIDMFDVNANKAIGTDLRGLMSNRKTRIKLENALNQLDETAANLGGKFDVDYKDLALFANGLDDRFGAVAQTSFTGDIESAIKQAGGQGATQSIKEAAIKKAASKAEELRGINDFNAFSSMRELLRRKK